MILDRVHLNLFTTEHSHALPVSKLKDPPTKGGGVNATGDSAIARGLYSWQLRRWQQFFPVELRLSFQNWTPSSGPPAAARCESCSRTRLCGESHSSRSHFFCALGDKCLGTWFCPHICPFAQQTASVAAPGSREICAMSGGGSWWALRAVCLSIVQERQAYPSCRGRPAPWRKCVYTS